MNKDKEILIDIKNLSKHYVIKKNIFSKSTIIKAVDDITLSIYKGESLGLIGESGCGKSTTASLILNLIKADEGTIEYKDKNIIELEEYEMRALRKDIQMIFQHNQGVLDPKRTIEESLMEPLKLHKIVGNSEMDKEVNRLLDLVEMPKSSKNKLPYEISGGQRQRIGIARAISTRPSFIVCDEPVSALDVSIQGQILNLLLDLKKELDLTYLFISHDLKVVKHICDRIGVMYMGKIIEIEETEKILKTPKEDYTKNLIGSQLL